MNNSDFLSDAVALDLGKSGVKVAETLEIEVGEEWWRLINAAAVTQAKVYGTRYETPGAIVGGEMNLSAFARFSQPVGKIGWNTANKHKTRLHTITVNEKDYYYGLRIQVNLQSAGNATYLHVWTDGDLLCEQTIATDTISLVDGSFYDATNNRILASGSNYHPIFSVATETVSVPGATSLSRSSDYYTVETFPEDPEYVYSFFFSSGGIKVKKILPAAAENVQTLWNRVVSNAGSTTLSTATGFSVDQGIFPFYLRTAESVGVAWADSATGQIKYLLESESWGTVHNLPLLPDASGSTVVGMGPAFFLTDGEFMMVALKGYDTGNVGLEAGYSFPTNFAVTGGYLNGEDCLRVFGIVGTTLYAYDLTLSTMEFQYLGAADSAWSYGSLECTKVGHSGDLDLLVFKGFSAMHAILALYDRVNNTFVWKWSNFTSSTLWPETYSSNCLSGSFYRVEDDLLILRSARGTPGKLNSYLIAIVDICTCMTTVAFEALLMGKRVAYAAIQPTGTYTYFGPTWTAKQSLTGLKYDDSFIYLIRSRIDDYVSPRKEVFTLGRTNRTQCILTRGEAANEYPWASLSSGYSMSMGVQSTRGDYLYDCRITDNDPSVDNMLHFGARGQVSSTYFPFMAAIYDIVSAPIAPSSYTAFNRSLYSTATVNLVPATGEAGETISYATYSKTMRIHGNVWDLINKHGGELDAWTASFSPTVGIVDEWNDATVYFGAISGGNLPYVKHSARQGLLRGMYAVSISDGTIYNLNMGHWCAGGLSAFSPCGSKIVYRSSAGMMHMLDTGAQWSDGIGGEIGDTSAAITYEYLNRQFIPYPFAREGIRAELSNISKTTKITLPETQDNLIRGMLAAGTDFRGSRCILRRVFPDHLDEEGSDIVLLDGYIQDWSYVPGKKGIAFSVSKTLIDVGGQFPKRLMNMGCSHVFKGARCQYLGEEGRCLKTRAFCTSLGNLNQFGGFPWVAARQRRVMWK